MIFWEWLMSASMHRFVLLSAAAGVGVSAFALLGGWLLGRRSAAARYGVLFVGVLGMLASPLFVAIGPALGWTATPVTETVRIPAERLLDAMASKTPEPAPPSTSEPGILEWGGAALVGVWLVGIAAGLTLLVRGHWKLQKTLVGEPWQPAWWTDERRADLAATIGLARFPPVRQSPFAPFPMVVGLRRPSIVLPAAAPESWTPSQWEAVLLHEAAHVARRDPLSALVQAAAVTLYWWWPVAHLLSRRIHDLRETICDDFALEGACDPAAYAELLMQSAERLVNLRTLPAAVGLLDSAHGGLKERITRLLTKEKRSMTRLSLAGKLLGPAALLSACLTIAATSAYSQAPAPHRNIQIKIVIDGKEFDLNDEVVQALLARQKAPQVAPKGVWQNGDQFLFEGMVVDDPRIDHLVRQAEAIKPGAGDAVRKLLVQSRSFDYWVDANKHPAEIEELVKRAEAVTPGSGAKIRMLLAGERHFDRATGMAVPSAATPIPPRPEVPYAPVLSFIVRDANGKQFHFGAEGPKAYREVLDMLYDLKKAKPGAAPGMTPPGMAAPTGYAPMGAAPAGAAPAPTKDRNDLRPYAAQLAQRSAELDALARQIERINAEVRALQKHIERESSGPPPIEQPSSGLPQPK